MGEAKRRKQLDPNYGQPQFKKGDNVKILADKLNPTGYVFSIPSKGYLLVLLDLAHLDVLRVMAASLPTLPKHIREMAIIGAKKYHLVLIRDKFAEVIPPRI